MTHHEMATRISQLVLQARHGKGCPGARRAKACDCGVEEAIRGVVPVLRQLRGETEPKETP